jgi:hypothetical protein
MPASDVHVELVHDPARHRAVIGWSADPALLAATAKTLIAESDRRASQFAGLDDVAAEAERAEAVRLRRVLALIFPDEDRLSLNDDGSVSTEPPATVDPASGAPDRDSG